MTEEQIKAERERFEAHFAGRKSKGAKHRESLFGRLGDGTYAQDHTQRHWWTWQNALASAATPAAQAVPKGWELTRSIIHDCPALMVPQSWIEKMAGAAQLVVLKGADDALAQRILSALNASAPARPAAPPAEDAALTAPSAKRDPHRGGDSYEASMLRDLLGRIHRDGGYYVEKHGLDEAIDAAHTKIASRMSALEMLVEAKRAKDAGDHERHDFLKPLAWAAAFAVTAHPRDAAEGTSSSPWAVAETISNHPAVHEALRVFAEDATGDNGTGVVCAVIEATRPAAPEVLAERWYVGSMNDGCAIINRPPRPSHDHPVHDADVRCIATFPTNCARTFETAQAICDAHNAALDPATKAEAAATPKEETPIGWGFRDTSVMHWGAEPPKGWRDVAGLTALYTHPPARPAAPPAPAQHADLTDDQVADIAAGMEVLDPHDPIWREFAHLVIEAIKSGGAA